jgi:predicted dehydrogenase
LIARDDIDVIDIAAPNNVHHEIAIAAAKAGKAILCEKPLALDCKEGEEMVREVEKAGVANMVWYNYRRIPAVTMAKEMIDEGRLGKVYHYRSNFLQDWTINTDLPQGGEGLWRLDAKVAGSGVTGDLLAHCIDTAIWLNGPIVEVSAMTETFIKERVHTKPQERNKKLQLMMPVLFLLKFANGSLAIFESTRYARGHKALYTFEINGADGSLFVGLARSSHRLDYYEYDKEDAKTRGWRSIHVTDNGGEHPYMDKWWVPGLNIGYEHSFINQFADFVDGFGSRKKRPITT